MFAYVLVIGSACDSEERMRHIPLGQPGQFPLHPLIVMVVGHKQANRYATFGIRQVLDHGQVILKRAILQVEE